MLKQHPEGITLGSLPTLFSKTYHRDLSFRALGFISVENLVASLDEQLLINGTKVFYKSELCSKEKEKVLKNIINMLKERPKGLRLKTLEKVYWQTYNTKMSIMTLGFTTKESLVQFLSKNLFIKGKRVHHVMYKKNLQSLQESANSAESSEDEASSTQPQGGLPATALSFLGPPLITVTPNSGAPTLPVGASGSAPRPAQEVTGIRYHCCCF